MEKHYRKYDHRIFVNRNVYMHNITCYGFDLDYTLIEYKAPYIHELIFEFAKENLIEMGYPKEIKDIRYNHEYTTRGLIFDTYQGNFLKVDPYGMILLGVHGFKFMDRNDISKKYPSRFANIRNKKRFVIYNTVFDLPETYLICALIAFFEDKRNNFLKIENGVEIGRTQITYATIQTDVDLAVNACHVNSTLKDHIIKNFEKYVNKRFELLQLIHRLKQRGKKTFIVTNSDYSYTNKMMSYLFDWPTQMLEKGMTTDWLQYFDIIIVNANKPEFFENGTTLKRVDINTGRCYIGAHIGPCNKGEVYQGGDSTILSEMLAADGKNIIYIGDHIFGDILKSKRQQGWRTFLVIPELRHEIDIWRTKKDYFDAVQNLESQMAAKFSKTDSNTCTKVDVTLLSDKIRDAVTKLENCYGYLGSTMRCGSHLTFFASQVSRFADLYSYSCYNLIYYPFDYFYRTPLLLLPHETTIKQINTNKVYKYESDNESENMITKYEVNNNHTLIVEEECEACCHIKAQQKQR